MTFISAAHDKRRDVIQVWEKVDGQRRLVEHDAPRYFYVPNPDGAFEALTGERLVRVDCRSRRELDAEVLRYPVRFESDIYPLEKALMDAYRDRAVPVLTVGFIDIEVDYTPRLGFPRPSNPYAPISALTLYRTDLGEYLTLAVPPPGVPAPALPDASYVTFASERELLEFFFALLEDVDVLSGWNSEFFDLPYLGKRAELLFGPLGLQRLAFPNGPLPRWGELERFKHSKQKELVLHLDSRVHLDYLRLFRKFNLEGRQSHSLAAITEDELDEPKLRYPGTLYDLYRNDFAYFCRYNRHDVKCLVDLDKKFRYIELANQLVHEATVNFSAVFTTVQLTDTTIMNFCHRELKKILPDKQQRADTGPVEGALVLSPKVGLHRWVGACDINSLYPSTYRSLNLSPEKVIGQLAEAELGWRAVYDRRLYPENDLLALRSLTLHLENGEELSLTVGDLVKLLEERRWALSAHGTVLDQSSGVGLIPAVIGYWINGRKEMQRKKKQFAAQARELLKVNGGNETDPAYVEAKTQAEYYDMLQGVRKVSLNSLYGAILSQYDRFFDQRLGSSTTDSGRQITTHMINTVSRNLLGEGYPQVIKTIEHDDKGKPVNAYVVNGPPHLGPVCADTDSCYFTMEDLVDNVDDAVACADALTDEVNASFPGFMRQAFLCQPGFDDLIHATRELVASSSIFRAKKKYILKVVDKEGVRVPDGHRDELKTMGSDIKLSSTPDAVREFLKKLTLMILRGENRDIIDRYVLEFRLNLKVENDGLNILDFATVTSVKELDKYAALWERVEKPGKGRVTMPSGARAVINHNQCLSYYGDQDTQPIIAGQKVKVVWLEPNDHGYTNIAFASETDAAPSWFNEHLKPDLKLTEAKLIDSKLQLIFEPLGWTIPSVQSVTAGRLLEF